MGVKRVSRQQGIILRFSHTFHTPAIQRRNQLSILHQILPSLRLLLALLANPTGNPAY
ncbi:hypothetical protein WRSd3_00298 [Shigella dysenteriae WRSd3]|uniref:Uncharacterized protein n=1 Tax=Shigella dysenteriae WRSd3 TaxID=1401327 RepID=A0A090NNL4_SHIDY|nr:hypothetical protein WRSd5_03586 [Shigella dysenteriae WRSd5]ESU82119.1 hypothetical protein WRSd3_00298 [Shigella dysenteriae WRSd3]